MFVEFEKSDLSGKALGSTWINTDSVFSVDVVRPDITSIRGGEFTAMVLGDVQSTLSKLTGK